MYSAPSKLLFVCLKVVDYKKPYYRVVYPDGDSEQLTGKELRPLIAGQEL
jgi:hypothetical protein